MDEQIEIQEQELEKEKKGAKPDFRVYQSVANKEGTTSLVDVGAMWKNISKNGVEFYSLKIGNLKLLVFKNDLKE